MDEVMDFTLDEEKILPYVFDGNKYFLPPDCEYDKKLRSLYKRRMERNKKLEKAKRDFNNDQKDRGGQIYKLVWYRPKEEYLDVEPDMRILDTDARDKEVRHRQIFADYPLVGLKVYTSEERKELLEDALKSLRKMHGSIVKYVTPEEKEKVFLAAVEIVKNWDGADATFTEYLCKCMGVPEDWYEDIVKCFNTGKLFNNDERWIYKDSQKENKSTLLIHALSPRKSWNSLLDLVDIFYRETLDSCYEESDPAIDMFMEALADKFRGAKGRSKNSVKIGAKAYQIQEGIQKLVVERPKYSKVLIQRILSRLEDTIDQRVEAPQDYLDQLLDDWYMQKIERAIDYQRKSRNARRYEVAGTRESIHPKYRLNDEEELVLDLPNIRQRQASTAYINLFLESADDSISVLMHHSLDVYQSDFVTTLRGTTVDLEKVLAKSAEQTERECCLRLEIWCDDNLLYNSEKELYRSCWLFEGDAERKAQNCQLGEYRVLVPNGSTIADDAGLQTLYEKPYGYKLCLFDLQEDASVFINGITLGNQKKKDKLWVKLPDVHRELEYVKDGRIYQVCDEQQNQAKIEVIVPENLQANQFILRCDDVEYPLVKLTSTTLGTSQVFEFPLAETGEGAVIQILEPEKERQVVDECAFICIPALKGEFNKLVYYHADDYKQAYLSVTENDKAEQKYPFGANDEQVKIPYGKGTLCFAIPKLTVGYWPKGERSKLAAWQNDWYWHKSLEDVALKVNVPDYIKCKVYLGEQPVEPMKIENGYDLDAMIRVGSEKDHQALTARIEKDGQSVDISLGTIVYKTMFMNNMLEIKVDGEDQLIWKHGRYIGEANNNLKLILSVDGQDVEYDLSLEEPLIQKNCPLLGKYEYKIVREKRSFLGTERVLMSQGEVTLGDITRIRFKNKRIKLLGGIKIDFLGNYPDQDIILESTYIEDIVYTGEKQDDNLGLVPVYEGVLYTKDNISGHRFDFCEEDSRKKLADGKEIRILAMHRVRITYLSELTLLLNFATGEYQGEALAVHHVKRNIFHLTDWNPDDLPKEKQGYYGLMDSYQYDVEENVVDV